jgi:hypothetical protein
MAKTLKRFKKKEEEGAKNKHGRKEWKAYIDSEEFQTPTHPPFSPCIHIHSVFIALYSIEDAEA